MPALQQLGMHDSHFVHPCGFDADEQYSTVNDLLRLARAAHADPRIAQIVRNSSSASRPAKAANWPSGTPISCWAGSTGSWDSRPAIRLRQGTA
jgi:hypothetical protein